MEIGNNIVVKVKLFDPSITYGVYKGYFLLYINNYREPHISGYAPTGVSFYVNDKVTYDIFNFFTGKKVTYDNLDGYLWLDTHTNNQNIPIGLVRFVPKNKHNKVKEFFGNFLMLTETG